MSTVGLIYKRQHARAAERARELAARLEADGVDVLLTQGQQAIIGAGEPADDSTFVRRSEFIVVLGGDGTLLHTAGMLRERSVPLLGINMGSLGFLTPFAEEEVDEALRAALAGELPIQERMRLAVSQHRDGLEQASGLATNDAVISQGAFARLLNLEARSGGDLITTYRADGLIVSTPTGSTAYNLAAGGPLLMPGMAALCVTPICPHTLTNRSLVLPAEAEITVEVGQADGKANLTIDGQHGFVLEAGDRIHITAAAPSLKLFMAPGRDIFELMRSKLRWSGSAVES